jgi:hypothetical protein
MDAPVTTTSSRLAAGEGLGLDVGLAAAQHGRMDAGRVAREVPAPGVEDEARLGFDLRFQRGVAEGRGPDAEDAPLGRGVELAEPDHDLAAIGDLAREGVDGGVGDPGDALAVTLQGRAAGGPPMLRPAREDEAQPRRKDGPFAVDVEGGRRLAEPRAARRVRGLEAPRVVARHEPGGDGDLAEGRRDVVGAWAHGLGTVLHGWLAFVGHESPSVPGLVAYGKRPG